MLDKASDYRFADVSGIRVTGEILPVRESRHPGAGRVILAEDLAFVTEALVERSFLGNVWDWYATYGTEPKKARQGCGSAISPMGRFDSDAIGFRYGYREPTDWQSVRSFQHGNGLRFEDIVKPRNEYLLAGWIESVERSLDTISLGAATLEPGFGTEMYCCPTFQGMDFSRIAWKTYDYDPFEDWATGLLTHIPVRLAQDMLGKAVGWKPGDGLLWAADSASRRCVYPLYERLAKIFARINTLAKFFVGAPDVVADCKFHRSNVKDSDEIGVKPGYGNSESYRYVSVSPGVILREMGGLESRLKAAHYIAEAVETVATGGSVSGKVCLNAYALDVESASATEDGGRCVLRFKDAVLGRDGTLSAKTMRERYGLSDAGESSNYGTTMATYPSLLDYGLVALEFDFRTRW